MEALNKYSASASATGQSVVCKLAEDPNTEWLRGFLRGTVHSLIEINDFVRRLGLPASSVENKLPYRKNPAREESIMLPAATVRMINARNSGALYAEHDPTRTKPRFRTSAPGIRVVIAANILLVWVLITAKV
ncbi:hypothetical protein WJX72_007136 [[Myrmecia] bisecta]|uniref:Uncharacterized protein n=1 Tax=[Myrmecia] bisecta TaxID=41462 RepID=A0AAW1R7Z5_9CHLO